MRIAIALVLTLGAAACAPTPPPATTLPPPPPGMDKVIGFPPATATALLGPATLDRSEPPGRVLQWSKPGCVLDVYYYPDAKVAGSAPVGRYAEARLRDGKAMDPGSCLTAQLAK
jgi:hypothetical protein